MSVNVNLPASFAVIGQQLMGPPIFKFYKRTIDPNQVNHVEALSQQECYGLSLESIDEDDYTPLVKCVSIPNHRDILWWSIPLYFENADAAGIIPVIEFQYKAWLPVSHCQLAASTQVNLQRIYSTVNAEIHSLIRNNTASSTHQGRSRVIRPPTPPRSYRSSSRSSSDLEIPTTPPSSYRDGDEILRRQVQGTPPIIHRRSHTPIRQQTSSAQHFALPENIGALILRDARAGEGECPITAVSYSECDDLSVTSCFHVFDAQSISRWWQDHSTCPVCRADIINIVNE